jgi:pimeloyl-ACP methyl ester carboxylesterase
MSVLTNRRAAALCSLLALAACGGDADRPADGRNVSFPARDGVRLAGTLFGSGDVAVVLSHMGRPGSTRADWAPLARALARRGHRVLTYDRRGACDIRGTACSGGVDENVASWNDAAGAVAFLRGRGARKVVVAGASIGAMSSVFAAARDDVTVDGLIEIGGVDDASGRRFTREDIEQIEGRKLFVSATGGAHGSDLLRTTAQRERLIGAVVAFVDRVAADDRAGATPDRSWRRVEPGGATACARGGRYAFWARPADRKRLVIFFQGGGGCFDERTCAPGSTWFDDSVTSADNPSDGSGVLDLDDARNPFRRWSWLFVPSCSGDVHLGDRRVRYGSVTVEQRGWQNAAAALRWAFRRFPEAEEVVVMGCSAGSVGSAFHVPSVIERWPRARVTQVGDSLAFVFHRPITLADWGAPKHFPAFFRVGARRFTMVEYLTALARRYPDRTFARFNHAGDDVQEAFYEAVGGPRGSFERSLRRAERTLKRLPNYRSFLACGDEHCSFPSPSFYSTRVAGVSLRDWLARLAAGRSVSCPTCPRGR